MVREARAVAGRRPATESDAAETGGADQCGRGPKATPSAPTWPTRRTSRQLVARSVAAFGRLEMRLQQRWAFLRATVRAGGSATHEMSRQSFDDMLAVNLTGVLPCA